MAVQTLRIGPDTYITDYDDTAYTDAIETTGSIRAATAPTTGNQVVRLADLSTTFASSTHQLNSTSGIDGTALGTTTLFTASEDLIVQSVVIILTAIGGAGVVPSVKIKNSAGSDVYPIASLVGLDTVNKTWTLISLGLVPMLLNTQALQLEVTIAATYASYTLRCDTFGYEKVP